jgi:hypothetical protein
MSHAMSGPLAGGTAPLMRDRGFLHRVRRSSTTSDAARIPRLCARVARAFLCARCPRGLKLSRAGRTTAAHLRSASSCSESRSAPPPSRIERVVHVGPKSSMRRCCRCRSGRGPSCSGRFRGAGGYYSRGWVITISHAKYAEAVSPTGAFMLTASRIGSAHGRARVDDAVVPEPRAGACASTARKDRSWQP